MGSKVAAGVPSKMTIIFDGDSRYRVQRIMDRLEVRSPLLHVKRSLALYDVMTEFVADGGKIIMKSADGTSRVFDPILFREEEESE